VIDGVPHLGALLTSFYEGRYADFMQALVDIYPAIAKDAFLHTHVAYYVREMRVAAYVQFLESYKRSAALAQFFRVTRACLKSVSATLLPRCFSSLLPRSVTMDGMARAFGVTLPFLDRELSRFISSGRLNARIDAVAGVVETRRPDSKNAQYLSLLKTGDALLNRIQKLSRVVSL
jgi:26S proteasome regulatory subunit N7